MHDNLYANLVMAIVLVLIVWNLVHAKGSGVIYVGLAKYIRNGSPEMRRWFLGGVIANVIGGIAMIVAFLAQLIRWIL